MLLRRLWLSTTSITTSRALDLFPNFNQHAIRLSSTIAFNMTRAAVISLSHGGGPLPLLGDPNHKDIVRSLKNRVPKILRLGTPDAPRAIIVVTAHWSTTTPTISNAEKHPLYYDYGGFPPESYKLKYDAPGSPSVAQEVYQELSAAGLKPKMDAKRGTSIFYNSRVPVF